MWTVVSDKDDTVEYDTDDDGSIRISISISINNSSSNDDECRDRRLHHFDAIVWLVTKHHRLTSYVTIERQHP